MGRRRWNKKHPDKARAQQQRPEDAGDPPVKLLALQPGRSVVAVGIGARVTLVDYSTGEEIKLAAPQPTAPVATGAADPAGPHAGALRVLQFSPDGRNLLTGGDDKAARLWLVSETGTAAGAAADGAAGAAGATRVGRCDAVWRTPKKTSAGGFSLDSSYALFADKFGDVLVGRVPVTHGSCGLAGGAAEGTAAEPQPQVPATLLGHFCSIVTSMAASPCGRYLATSDKDYKVRVSVLPADLTHGSFEIQSYCLGHQDFVSSIAFATQQPGQQQREQQAGTDGAWAAEGGNAVLISGSGDGTVRMWDYVSGKQLASYVASAPVATAAPAAGTVAGGDAGEGEAATGEGSDAEEGGEAAPSGDGDDGGEEEGEGAAGEGDEGAAGADGGDGGFGGEPQRRRKAPLCAPVRSLAVSPDGDTVAVVVEGDDEVQVLSIDWGSRSLQLRQRLRWPDVRYPCQVAFGSDGQLWVVGGMPLPTARSVHVGVARTEGPGGSFQPCTDRVLSAAVRSLLEVRVQEEEAKMAEGGELFVYSKHLRKPEYDEKESLARKRMRNDHRETMRLAALRQRQDEQAKAKQQQQQGEAAQQQQPQEQQ